MSLRRMTTADLQEARTMFRERIDSLEGDTKRCFWPIADPSAPGPAYFPPVMYAFATIDYFSGLHAGWSDTRLTKNEYLPKEPSQNKRMASFMERFLLYPQKEAQIAIRVYRHALMHAATPSVLINEEPYEVYYWGTGDRVASHMRLEQVKCFHFRLEFSPLTLVRDLRDGVFGARGYFEALRFDNGLQDKYTTRVTEMRCVSINL